MLKKNEWNVLKRVEIVVKDDAKFFRRSGAEAESSSEKNDVIVLIN